MTINNIALKFKEGKLSGSIDFYFAVMSQINTSVVIDLRLASSRNCCFSATRDYSILLLRYFRSRKYSDAMPSALVLYCIFTSPARGSYSYDKNDTRDIWYMEGFHFQRYFRMFSFFSYHAMSECHLWLLSDAEQVSIWAITK